MIEGDLICFLKFQPVSDPSLPLLSASEIRRVMEDLEDANVEKDQLMQKCHNLEIQVNLLQDEKNNITAEYELLQKEVRSNRWIDESETLNSS